MSKQPLIIFGLHSVIAQLSKDPLSIEKILIAKERHDKKILNILKELENKNITFHYVNREELDRSSDNGNHQGIVAFCQPIRDLNENDLEEILDKQAKPFLLILDGVQDPHNLGACLRSAEAAGVHAVIAPRDKASSLTPVVRKVASGAAELIPFIQVTNLARTLNFLKERGIWIFGAAEDGKQNYFEANLTGPIAIVLGGEGKGLRRLTKEHCDVLIKIPMLGSVSSLNVSVATGILLFEVVRQRM